MKNNFFDTSLSSLKGISAKRAEALEKELQLKTFGDLLHYFPHKYEDRRVFANIYELGERLGAYVQLKGFIEQKQTRGQGAKMRLHAILRVGHARIELVWFNGLQGISSFIKPEREYIVYGKVNAFQNDISIQHPEIELASEVECSLGLVPVYTITPALRRSVPSKVLSKLIRSLVSLASEHMKENLPDYIISESNLLSHAKAIEQIHFPSDYEVLEQARRRLAFEEIFYLQLRLLKDKQELREKHDGFACFQRNFLEVFHNNHLSFSLTGAQNRVIDEIYKDMCSGKQMNRLLQGDVGSGKTIVAFSAILIALSNGGQACFMAPTEVLAEQHFRNLEKICISMGIDIELLSGSTKPREKKRIKQNLFEGSTKLVVGTHALIQDDVHFENLLLCIIDEQHRFGVAQRAKLWEKNDTYIPHVLVMSATPIPRTLAMTVYGNLDISVIDEMPAGRKPIITAHRYENKRLAVWGFIKKEIEQGRQVYIVYPLIEESEVLDYQNLYEGYEAICRDFPGVHISIVHGQMKPADKDIEMQRFAKKETQIMVATTVIEVGIDVPNASIMVIESAERFGLLQLHQLRGRVGRGTAQSYCILMTSYKLSKESRARLEAMVDSPDGFYIAEKDLEIRGPGDLTGTQQSGMIRFKLADLSKDYTMLERIRETVKNILNEDKSLELPKNQILKKEMKSIEQEKGSWYDF